MPDTIYKEYIGGFAASTQDARYNVRVWREENNWDANTIKRNREEISMHIFGLKGNETLEQVAEHILSLERVNAVEVLDVIPKGNGIVIYRNWP